MAEMRLVRGLLLSANSTSGGEGGGMLSAFGWFNQWQRRGGGGGGALSAFG